MQNDKWPSRFTYALTGYGCRTNKEASIVEAANIHSFSKSQNGESRAASKKTRSGFPKNFQKHPEIAIFSEGENFSVFSSGDGMILCQHGDFPGCADILPNPLPPRYRVVDEVWPPCERLLESRSFPIQKRTVLGTLGQKTAF